EDGNKLVSATDKDGKEVTITLEQALDKEYLEEKEYTLSYTFEYETIEGEDRTTEKTELADTILQKLKNGEDFKTLALEYSEEFLTHLYKDGYMVSGDLINDETAIKAIDKLEIGDMTEDLVSISSGKYLYIVKRIDLTEKAYTHAEEDAEDTTYAEIFANFRTTVKNYTYSELLKTYTENISINTNVIDKYTMADTFLSKEIYYTYG
ncbi:MAG: peptidylprolyl isomerase, partial [Clostridia bacterium]|nr:peptidylprolyl isomerase [Clostridia bacterium]